MPTLLRNLKTAIHIGDVADVKKLLKSVKKPLNKDPFLFGGYNLLKLAIGLRKKKIAKLLIKKGARVNKKYRDKSFSCLHNAVRQRSLNLVKLLVKNGAEVNVTCLHNVTPLMVAIFVSELQNLFPTSKIVKFLLNNGANVEVKLTERHWTGATALNIACHYESFKIAKLILKHNAQVNRKSFFNSPPIVDTVIINSVKLTTLLLNYGAHVNSAVSDEFLERGMVINLIKKRLKSLGNPIVLHAAIACQNIEMVELLINHGADINYRTKSFQRTPLMLAIEEYEPEIVKLLLVKGATIDTYDQEGMSPLHYLICNPKNLKERFNLEMLEELQSRKIEILDSLVKAGADVNEALKPLGTKLTFLTTAATYGQNKIIRYLEEGGYLDLSLMDCSVLQAVKLNIELLSQEQINNQRFMVAMKILYISTECCLVRAIFGNYYRNLPVDKKLLAAVRSKPVNDVWNHYSYLIFVKQLEHDLQKCVESMKKDKIGTSTISFWDLLTSPWDRLINHACNDQVRKLSIDKYNYKYSPYFHILKHRINAAVNRSKVLEKSTEIVFSLFKTLPLVCCEKIVATLADKDLEIFINTFSNFL